MLDASVLAKVLVFQMHIRHGAADYPIYTDCICRGSRVERARLK